MKQVTLSYKPGLIKGLRTSTKMSRDSMHLTTAIGVHPLDEGLTTAEVFEELNLDSISCSFPYPQVFKLSGRTIICTSTAIYEYAAGAATVKLSGLTAGCLWSVADFNTYILLYNGKVVVKLNPQTNVWALDTTLPKGSCVCSVGGQIIVGGYNSIIPDLNIDGIDHTIEADALTAVASISGTFS